MKKRGRIFCRGCFKGCFLQSQGREDKLMMGWDGSKTSSSSSSGIVTEGRRRGSRWPRLPSIWCRIPSEPPFSLLRCLSPTLYPSFALYVPFALSSTCCVNPPPPPPPPRREREREIKRIFAVLLFYAWPFCFKRSNILFQ